MAGSFNPKELRADMVKVIAAHFDNVADDNRAGFNLFDIAMDACVSAVLTYAMERNNRVQLRASAWLRKNRTTVRQHGARVGVAGFHKG
jgi:DNA-binding protein Fis